MLEFLRLYFVPAISCVLEAIRYYAELLALSYSVNPRGSNTIIIKGL